jgi:hypothetical protein
MNNTQKPDSQQSHERKPTSPQHDDNKQHPGQSKPAHPDRQDHRDADRNAPHKK